MGTLRESNVRRRAWKYLLKDFQQRCAYSMRHIRMAGGDSQMEVDHFNPTLKGPARNRYSNLMLATAHCNLRKRNYWPNQKEQRDGFRLVNPCLEQDYELHIFEDPVTHMLIGVTKAGRYHIDVCDLNDDTFVWERRKRAEYWDIKRRCPALLSGPFEELQRMFDLVREVVELFIPEIEPPPAGFSL